MEKLKKIREEIEKIDDTIIRELANRKKFVKEIGRLKLESNLCVFDPERETQLFNHYKSLCEKYDLDFTFIKNLFEIIFSYSHSLQKL